MHGVAADVVDLKLPARAKVTLYADRPLFGVGRVELGWQHNELRLRKELRDGWSRDLILGKGIGRDGAGRPRSGEADRSRGRRLCLLDGRGKGRVLLVTLRGVPVCLVEGQLHTRTNDCLS